MAILQGREAGAVAVAAFPVVLPDVSVTFPVTFPLNVPVVVPGNVGLLGMLTVKEPELVMGEVPVIVI